MKRGKKLLAMAAALILLVGATFAATKLNPENETEEETDTVILELDPETIDSVSWDYSEAVSFVRTDGGWEYADDPVFPLDETFLDGILETLSQVLASKTIEGAEDLDQYGLEVPVCAITVTAGESTYELAIGEETGMGGERYFSTGDGMVYLVEESAIDPFSYGLYDLLSYETIPTMEDVTALTVESDVQSYVLEYLPDSGLAYSDEYVWFMEGTALDTDLTQALVETVTSMAWSQCVSYYAEDLSVYGLDTPTVTVTVGYTDEEGNDQSFVLQIGDEATGGSYARLDGSHMVYLIDASISETLLYTAKSELLPDEVLAMDWDGVTGVNVTMGGDTYTFTKETKTVTDDEGTETEETVYLLGGEEVDLSGLTDGLDAMTTTGYATGLAPERSEEIRIVIYQSSEAYPEVELVFYQYDSTSCLTTLNGESTVFASREDVVALVEAVHSLVLN